MKNSVIRVCSFLLLYLIAFQAIAQKTIIREPPQETYLEALTLFQNQNYGSAQKEFDRFMKEVDDPSNTFYENASYYSTVCAVHLGNKDALNQVKAFASAYPESAWIPTINFELGNLYFDNRDYTEALNSFKQVVPKQLSKEQKEEFYYKKGYCELEIGRLDAALNSFENVQGTKSSYGEPAKYYTAHIYYQKEQYSKALDGFKALEDSRRFGKYVPGYLIHIYYELGDNQKVIDEGLPYLDKTDNKSKAKIASLIANAYFNLGDYDQALEYFNMYENNTRTKITSEENYRIGYCKFLKGEYKGAIYNFQEASRENEKFIQNAWYHLGFCYLNTGETKFAQNAFLKAYREGNDKALATDALYNYVRITIKNNGDPYNDPVAILEEYISKNTEQSRINEAYDLLAQLYVSSSNYRGALTSIEKTRNPSPRLKEIYQQLAYSQGVEYFNRAEYAEAIGYFQKALTYTPDQLLESKTIYWIADAFYRQKNFTDAEGMFASFLKSGSARKTGLYAMGLYGYAYSAFNLKNYTLASDYFNRFLSEKGNDPDLISDASLRLADSYYISKNYKMAMSWYDKVIAEGNQGTDYAIYQKAFCYGAEGNFNMKITTLKVLAGNYSSSPLYADALYEIASTNLVLNDQRDAIVYFDKLVKEKPNSSLAKKSLIKMGFVYYNNKQYDRAIVTLKKVVNTYPASPEATEALTVLQNVYMDTGKVNEYFAYVKTLDFVQVSTSTEDSLTFTTGENYYFNNDCQQAVSSLQSYLKKFPNGGFVLKSYFYLSQCFEKQNMQDQAVEYYEKIIAFPDNPYTNNALLKLARIAFDKENFQQAYDYYVRLTQLAENQGMILEANDGAMRCSFLNGDFRAASSYANQLLQIPVASENQIVYAHYVLATAALESNNISVAEQQYTIVDEMTTGALGAESKFMLAALSFQKRNYDQAEMLIYELPEQYSDFDYWIARGFILLSDIYVQRGNNFQAEQTLQSVIDNYTGEDLKVVAIEKLEKLKPADKPNEKTEEIIDND